MSLPDLLPDGRLGDPICGGEQYSARLTFLVAKLAIRITLSTEEDR